MKSESSSVIFDSLPPHGLYSSWNSPGQNTGVGSLFLLQGIFSTQGLNQGLLHCGQILYQQGYQRNPFETVRQRYLHNLKAKLIHLFSMSL